MPKAGVKQDQKRRAKSAVKAAQKSPPKSTPADGGKAPKSPLAEYLSDATPQKRNKVMQLAQGGQLGVQDVQAAIVAELSNLNALLLKKPAEINAQRPVYVMRQRLLRDLQEVILKSAQQGTTDFQAIWNIQVVFRNSGSCPPSDPVRTSAPPESEWGLDD